ncbi:MAG: LLM class flavin-dependent oxidoreductase [Gammaproteobacteria bacterium]
MSKMIHMNAFTQCSICHHSKGQWKHPLDGSSRGYRDVDYWVDLARLLERGCFDTLFLADVHGTYNVYKGSREAAVRHAVQFPSNDPTLVISAMAYATRHLGFACTYSTTYFPPYQAAKVFSTLDHLTRGRIAWNIVTSYLADANANFGLDDQMPHDERYDRAEEYMEVVYQLWEHSWEEDAMVRDGDNDMHTDPAKVHEINYRGTYFNVPGPHMCEPSAQRTPVLYQAGQSGRGVKFAARHAEAIFAIYPHLEACRKGVKLVRQETRAAGRKADHVKVFPGISVIVAPTDAEAQLKLETCKQYRSPEGALALFCGWIGIDIAKLPKNVNLLDMKTEAIQGLISYFAEVDPNRFWTIQDIGELISIGSVMPKVVGSPQTVADELERWVDDSGCDGFNLVPVVQPSGFRDFVDLVVPELQRRGRMRTAYEGETLRESYFGAGHQRLFTDHVAHRSLPAWKKKPARVRAAAPGVSKAKAKGPVKPTKAARTAAAAARRR